MLYRSVKPSNP